MEYINQIINTTLESFDFSFCITVNILTYVIIKGIDECNGNAKVNTWVKRLVLLLATFIISVMYYFTGSDCKLIINSAILAPVFWSWIGKPICTKLDIDYNKDVDDNINL